MPKLNGVDAARQILKGNPAQRILVLTDVNAEQVVRDCLEAVVRGWVFKSDGTDDLTTAVEAQRHQSIFSSRVSGLDFGRLPAAASRWSSRARGAQIVAWLAKGNLCLMG